VAWVVEISINFRFNKLKYRNHFEDTGLGGRTVFSGLQRNGTGRSGPQYSGLWQELAAGSSDHINKRLGSVKLGNKSKFYSGKN